LLSSWVGIFIILFLIIAGCSAPQQTSTPSIEVTSTPAAIQTTINATSVPTTTPTQKSTVVVTTQNLNQTKSRISDNQLNGLIQDSKNKLNLWKESDMADTISTKFLDCDIIESKEIGYLIDVSDGKTYFIKGDYGSIRIAFMTNKSHEYIFLHSHPKYTVTCNQMSSYKYIYDNNFTYIHGEKLRNFKAFSIDDLIDIGELTKRGHHILKSYVISDHEYEIFPGEEFGWKSKEVIDVTIQEIEKERGMKFNEYDDRMMDSLARGLGINIFANNLV